MLELLAELILFEKVLGWVCGGTIIVFFVVGGLVAAFLDYRRMYR